MRVSYDDFAEFAEVVIRCGKTAEKGECMRCPFYDRCQNEEQREERKPFAAFIEEWES